MSVTNGDKNFPFDRGGSIKLHEQSTIRPCFQRISFCFVNFILKFPWQPVCERCRADLDVSENISGYLTVVTMSYGSFNAKRSSSNTFLFSSCQEQQ